MESKARSYKDLIAWQKGIQLTKLVYKLTSRFPAEEKFGFISQIRRAAVSIPSNIPEGQARRTSDEFIQFISNAEGSIAETDTQLILSVELGFCRQVDVAGACELVVELQKMLNARRRKLLARS